MIALRQRKRGWPLEGGRSHDRWCSYVRVGMILSLSDRDGACILAYPLILFSAVLEVPVFTVAGEGLSYWYIPTSLSLDRPYMYFDATSLLSMLHANSQNRRATKVAVTLLK
jgi:hypothetical protein